MPIYQSYEEINDEVRRDSTVKEEPTLTPEQQAQSQTSPQSNLSAPTPPQQEEIPEGRFLNPKGGSSAVDLSKKVNRDKMWEEYEEWSKLGKPQFLGRPNPFAPIEAEFIEQRQALQDQWFLKYYGMTHEEHEQKRKEMSEKYQPSLTNLNDKF